MKPCLGSALLVGLLLPTGCQRSCAKEVRVAAADAAVAQPQTYPGTLDAVLAHRRLRVLMSQTAGRALPRAGTPLGAEREVMARFAQDLDVELEIIHPPSFDDLLGWLAQGRGDVAVGALTITPARLETVDFTNPVDTVQQVLVGHKDGAEVKSTADLDGKTVVAQPGSVFYRTLEALRGEVPGLTLRAAAEDLSTQQLLEQVGRKEIPYTVSNSGLAQAVAGYDPNLRILLPLTQPKPIAWAVSKGADRLRARLDAMLTRTAMTPQREEVYAVDLAGIKQRKVLRVLTRNNGITYWLHQGREVGLEYELVRAFADQLGVRLELVVPPARGDLVPWLQQGRGDLIAAMFAVTPARSQEVAFGAPYLSSGQQVVTRAGAPPVRTAADLAGRRVHVHPSSPYFDTLTALSATLPSPIDIAPIEQWVETEQVLRDLADGSYDITLAYAHIAQAEARYEPRLVLGPEVGPPMQLAWAVRPDAPELKAAIDRFFTRGDYRPRGLMYNILLKRYLAPGEHPDATRGALRPDRPGAISPFDDLTKKHAATYRLDWRLVTAQMYQESRFDPNARSPVGALGLMQVMPATARGLDVGDPRLPDPGIHAGVLYMRQLIDQHAPRQAFGERYRFALASYNAGKGHVDDARRLALELKLDPDLWFDNVEQAMLLLERSAYARRARYGYCRGSEPVRYVSQIQSRFEAYSEFVKE